MTANQIIIPLCGMFLLSFVVFLALRARRINAAKVQTDHAPNAPAGGHDKGAIARSAMHGHGHGGSI